MSEVSKTGENKRRHPRREEVRMKTCIEEDLQKIFMMLLDIEKRTKDPKYRALAKKLKKQYEKIPKCPSCGNPTDADGKHYCMGEKNEL